MACQNGGRRKPCFNFCNSVGLHIQLDEYLFSYVHYHQLLFINLASVSRADGFLFPPLRQAVPLPLPLYPFLKPRQKIFFPSCSHRNFFSVFKHQFAATAFYIFFDVVQVDDVFIMHPCKIIFR